MATTAAITNGSLFFGLKGVGEGTPTPTTRYKEKEGQPRRNGGPDLLPVSSFWRCCRFPSLRGSGSASFLGERQPRPKKEEPTPRPSQRQRFEMEYQSARVDERCVRTFVGKRMAQNEEERKTTGIIEQHKIGLEHFWTAPKEEQVCCTTLPSQDRGEEERG